MAEAGATRFEVPAQLLRTPAGAPFLPLPAGRLGGRLAGAGAPVVFDVESGEGADGYVRIRGTVRVDEGGAVFGRLPVASCRTDPSCSGVRGHLLAPAGAAVAWLIDAGRGCAVELEPSPNGYAVDLPIAKGGRVLDGAAARWIFVFADCEGCPLPGWEATVDWGLCAETVYPGPRRASGGRRIGRRERVRVEGTLTVARPGADHEAWVVAGGELEVGGLALEPGASLVVERGKVVLSAADGAVEMAGSFTLTDSWGSLYIQGDTTISGSALYLVSHIVISDGVLLRVTGDLTLDGCVVEAAGAGARYFVHADPGSRLAMSRSVVRGCGRAGEPEENRGLYVNTGDATIESCVFESNTVGVVVGPAAAGAAVFHNLFRDNTEADLLVQTGGATFARDGWGNVYGTAVPPPEDPAPAADTANNLVLDVAGSDAAGDIYVRPGTDLAVGLAVDGLRDPVSGCEALLGYSSFYFPEAPLFEPTSPWDYLLYQSWTQPGPGTVALDTAVGLGLNAPREGTSADGAVATLSLTAGTNEGVTRVYFRLSDTGLDPVVTRLTSDPDGVSGRYLLPFTMNSGFVTIDGTPPLVRDVEGWQSGVDVLLPGNVCTPGGVLVMASDRDALSGVDGGGATVSVVSRDAPPVVLPAAFLYAYSVSVAGETWTRRAWWVSIAPETPPGLYDVQVRVLDRAGNAATADAFLSLLTKSIGIAVEMEGWNGAAGATRDVAFTATDASGTVVRTWNAPVELDAAGLGWADIYGVPEATVALSAKTAWSLRRRLPVTFGPGGTALAAFTGGDLLPGGDLNGDNRVTTLDYARLLHFWYTTEPAADISGDGQASATDLGIMRFNWYTEGASP